MPSPRLPTTIGSVNRQKKASFLLRAGFYLFNGWNVTSIIRLTVALSFVALLVHRSVALTLTTKTWAAAPINYIPRDCEKVSYESLADYQQTHPNTETPKICMTTLTDEQAADWLQRMLKWRQFNNLLEMTWPNKQAYCKKHGYHLYDSSPYLDTTRPPSWSKIVAARRLLTLDEAKDGEKPCDWVVWLDADTVVMNSQKKLEDILPSPTLKQDLVITRQKFGSYNAGAWMIRNTPWAIEFLDTWWGMEKFVRPKGLSVSGDNDALKHYLKETMTPEYFQEHVVVPPRCTFNSVTKWVTPEMEKEYAKHPDLVKKEEWYMHEEYYHQGDLIAHVAGTNVIVWCFCPRWILGSLIDSFFLLVFCFALLHQVETTRLIPQKNCSSTLHSLEVGE